MDEARKQQLLTDFANMHWLYEWVEAHSQPGNSNDAQLLGWITEQIDWLERALSPTLSKAIQ